MDLTTIALLGGTGLAGGAVNAVAGGGSLLTYPALVAVGLPAVTASCTNTAALWPGYLGAAAASWQEGHRADALRRSLAPAVVGAAIGAMVLLRVSEDLFDRVVPVLILGSVGALWAQPRLARRRPSSRPGAALPAGAVVAGAYGAFFGGGLGVLLLAVLSFGSPAELTHLNAVKALAGLAINTVALVAFVIAGGVAWSSVAVVAPASLLGGLAGGAWANRLAPDRLRLLVGFVGVVAAVGFVVA